METLSGVVSFLQGKLKDYRGNYGIDIDELRGCAQLWRSCVCALGAGSTNVVDRQARALIATSMERHVQRLRQAVAEERLAAADLDEAHFFNDTEAEVRAACPSSQGSGAGSSAGSGSGRIGALVWVRVGDEG